VVKHDEMHGERAEREPLTGVCGSGPSGVDEQSPWLGATREIPLKLKAY